MKCRFGFVFVLVIEPNLARTTLRDFPDTPVAPLLKNIEREASSRPQITPPSKP
jgi:hypothetical protein